MGGLREGHSRITAALRKMIAPVSYLSHVPYVFAPPARSLTSGS